MLLAPAREIARALDPCQVALAMGIDPDPWQRNALLTTAYEAQEAIWLASRQSGKTETARVLGLWTAMYRRGTTTAIISPSQRQSTEMMTRVRAGFYRMGRPMTTVGDSATQLAFTNGSRLIALPASEGTTRGLSVDLLILDEASKIPGSVYQAMRPSLAATGGKMVALSTPFGRRGWFADAWHDEAQPFHRVKVTADQCPRISQKWLDRERATLGELAFMREYFCMFDDTETQLFTSDLLQRAVRDDILPLSLPTPEGAAA